MENMQITSAQYTSQDGNTNDAILATIDNKVLSVPIFVGNRHYDEIMRQVEAGELTIAEAD